MQEELISFETAKLVKEKGYIIRSEPYRYTPGGDLSLLEGINAPTQSLLQKWLREEHSIDVLVDKGFLSNKYSYEVLYKNDMLDSEYIFKTFEKALEIGLYEALKLI